ncbi:multicopper oxidase family protein [Pseudonocardia eucalypti]|uniref:Multicopper oxidase family protein n=1 Tax=Pseudonocardia eucalypti TaxID=648755 RepID=A0ABP9PFE4_9PSEU
MAGSIGAAAVTAGLAGCGSDATGGGGGPGNGGGSAPADAPRGTGGSDEDGASDKDGASRDSGGRSREDGEVLPSELPLPAAFVAPLPIPPVRRPVDGRIEIAQRVGRARILPGLDTPVFGYDGIFPGPTIETRRDEPVTIVHHNELPVPTVTHLHGGHTPAEHDGWPLDLLLPAATEPMSWLRHGMPGNAVVGTREHVYPMRQRAATLWYHDHRMDFTGPQVWRGLAGFHLVRDAEEDALRLPAGRRELPLMLCDRSFDARGRLLYPSVDPSLRQLPGVERHWLDGVLGDVQLVNGAPWPVVEVDAARYRLRLLNAANARRYRLAWQPGGEFLQVGSDGGLLAAPVGHREIDIVPGERFDVVVDFGGYPVGSEVTMVNRLGEGRMAEVMRFRITSAATGPNPPVPDRLGTVEPLRPPAGAPTRKWRVTRGQNRRTDPHSSWTINDRPFDPSRDDATARLGEVERWLVTSDLHHPLHVHLDPFQVLSRGGRRPLSTDAGWKDTVDLRPGERLELAVRFADYSGRYVFHCHNLEHEDMAMMAVLRTAS